MKAIIESLRIGPEKNFTYLIACPKTKEAALVDPSFEFDRVLEWVQSLGDFKVTHLLATHGHWDHAGGFPEMIKRLPRVQVVAQKAEKERLAKMGVPLDVSLDDGEIFNVGNVKVKALHTKGHTEGGCCYQVENQIFTGDTLFIGSCGRTDFEGGSDAEMFESLKRLARLPSETIVRPGHDYGKTPISTIGFETQNNPSMLAKTLPDFLKVP